MIKEQEFRLINDFTLDGVFNIQDSLYPVYLKDSISVRAEFDNTQLAVYFRCPKLPTHTRIQSDEFSKYYFLVKEDYINEDLYAYSYVCDAKSTFGIDKLQEYSFIERGTFDKYPTSTDFEYDILAKDKKTLFQNTEEVFVIVAPKSEENKSPTGNFPLLKHGNAGYHNFSMISNKIKSVKSYKFSSANLRTNAKINSIRVELRYYPVAGAPLWDTFEATFSFVGKDLILAQPLNKSSVMNQDEYVGESGLSKIRPQNDETEFVLLNPLTNTQENIFQFKAETPWSFTTGAPMPYTITFQIDKITLSKIIGGSYDGTITVSSLDANGTPVSTITDIGLGVDKKNGQGIRIGLNSANPAAALTFRGIKRIEFNGLAIDNGDTGVISVRGAGVDYTEKDSLSNWDFSTTIDTLYDNGYEVLSIVVPPILNDAPESTKRKTVGVFEVIEEYYGKSFDIELPQTQTPTVVSIYNKVFKLFRHKVKSDFVNIEIIPIMDILTTTLIVKFSYLGSTPDDIFFLTYDGQLPYNVTELQKWTLQNSQSKALFDLGQLQTSQSYKYQNDVNNYNLTKGLTNAAINAGTGAVAMAATGGAAGGANVLNGATSALNSIMDYNFNKGLLAEKQKNELDNNQKRYDLNIKQIAGLPNITAGSNLSGFTSLVSGVSGVFQYNSQWFDPDLELFLKLFGVKCNTPFIIDNISSEGYLSLKTNRLKESTSFIEVLNSQLNFFYEKETFTPSTYMYFIADDGVTQIQIIKTADNRLQFSITGLAQTATFGANKLYGIFGDVDPTIENIYGIQTGYIRDIITVDKSSSGLNIWVDTEYTVTNGTAFIIPLLSEGITLPILNIVDDLSYRFTADLDNRSFEILSINNNNPIVAVSDVAYADFFGKAKCKVNNASNITIDAKYLRNTQYADYVDVRYDSTQFKLGLFNVVQGVYDEEEINILTTIEIDNQLFYIRYDINLDQIEIEKVVADSTFTKDCIGDNIFTITGKLPKQCFAKRFGMNITDNSIQISSDGKHVNIRNVLILGDEIISAKTNVVEHEFLIDTIDTKSSTLKIFEVNNKIRVTYNTRLQVSTNVYKFYDITYVRGFPGTYIRLKQLQPEPLCSTVRANPQDNPKYCIYKTDQDNRLKLTIANSFQDTAIFDNFVPFENILNNSVKITVEDGFDERGNATTLVAFNQIVDNPIFGTTREINYMGYHPYLQNVSIFNSPFNDTMSIKYSAEKGTVIYGVCMPDLFADYRDNKIYFVADGPSSYSFDMRLITTTNSTLYNQSILPIMHSTDIGFNISNTQTYSNIKPLKNDKAFLSFVKIFKNKLGEEIYSILPVISNLLTRMDVPFNEYKSTNGDIIDYIEDKTISIIDQSIPETRDGIISIFQTRGGLPLSEDLYVYIDVSKPKTIIIDGQGQFDLSISDATGRNKFNITNIKFYADGPGYIQIVDEVFPFDLGVYHAESWVLGGSRFNIEGLVRTNPADHTTNIQQLLITEEFDVFVLSNLYYPINNKITLFAKTNPDLATMVNSKKPIVAGSITFLNADNPTSDDKDTQFTVALNAVWNNVSDIFYLSYSDTEYIPITMVREGKFVGSLQEPSYPNDLPKGYLAVIGNDCALIKSCNTTMNKSKYYDISLYSGTTSREYGVFTANGSNKLILPDSKGFYIITDNHGFESYKKNSDIDKIVEPNNGAGFYTYGDDAASTYPPYITAAQASMYTKKFTNGEPTTYLKLRKNNEYLAPDPADIIERPNDKNKILNYFGAMDQNRFPSNSALPLSSLVTFFQNGKIIIRSYLSMSTSSNGASKAYSLHPVILVCFSEDYYLSSGQELILSDDQSPFGYSILSSSTLTIQSYTIKDYFDTAIGCYNGKTGISSAPYRGLHFRYVIMDGGNGKMHLQVRSIKNNGDSITIPKNRSFISQISNSLSDNWDVILDPA